MPPPHAGNNVGPGRLAAFKLLREWFRNPKPLNDFSFDRVLSDRDAALARELSAGVLRWWVWIDAEFGQIARDWGHLPRDLQVILRLAAYQRRFLDRIPDHAIRADSQLFFKQSKLPVNMRGVLTALLMRLELVHRPPTTLEIAGPEPWTAASHPRWLWERWSTQWGPQTAWEAMTWNNRPAPVYVRDRFPGGVIPSELTPVFGFRDYLALNGVRLEALPGWTDGRWVVQDPAMSLPVNLALADRPGELADLAAAPGGKSIQAADSLLGLHVYSFDSDNDRVYTLINNIKQCDLSSQITVECADIFSLQDRVWPAVLLDAPCSAFGVLRRHPEARWLKTDDLPRKMAEIQLGLLNHAAGLVTPGGVLVYSVCSLEAEETTDVLQAFLAEHPDWVTDPPDLRVTAPYRLPDGTFRTLPWRDGLDGGFAVRLRAPGR